MSVLSFFTDENFDTGDLVCVDPSTGLAIPYNDKYRVVGVAMRPLKDNQPNGRMYYNINGPTFYENDSYYWNDDLMGNFSEYNFNYEPYNPLNDIGYISVVINGMSAIKKTAIGIPADWILLKEKENYFWYLIR